MSLKVENVDPHPPRPWSPKPPPSPMQDTPGGFPFTPTSESHEVGAAVPQSLSAAVRTRRDQYVRKRTIKVKVGTWNVASINGTEKDLGEWFVKGLGVKGMSQNLASESNSDLPNGHKIESAAKQEDRMGARQLTVPKGDVAAVTHDDEVGLYVLGLQEVVDVASVTEAMKPFTDPNPGKKWKAAMRNALPPGYEKIANQQLLGLLILVFASPKVVPMISSVSCTSVGTGLMGYLGNKGAVAVRIVLAENTRLCFVNCHLAAGADQAALNRRIWDTSQIVAKTRFGAALIDGEQLSGEEKIGDEDFAFWFGDLNYRLDDIPGEDVRRLLLLHTRNEYDVSNKSRRKIDSELGYVDPPPDHLQDSGPKKYEYQDAERAARHSSVELELDPQSDPASLVTTIKSLLSHDQLYAQQRLRKAFHDGWREGDVNFLPTYKYDVGSIGMFDSGEKKRSPSWCDRILFRTRTDRLKYVEWAEADARARKKDEEMKKKGLDKENEEQDVLFDYDPDTDGLAYGDDYDEEEDAHHDAELVQTKEGFEEDIALDHYISHQRVLSSDHKPLDACFTLTYDAVIPELKAQVQQEVAKELDKAENEGRPTITVVVDDHFFEDATITNQQGEDRDLGSVDFGQVRYHVPKTRSVTVANTGPIAAAFHFVSREDTGSSSQGSTGPDWLNLHSPSDDDDKNSSMDTRTPYTGEHVLQPGDTKLIEMTIQVSDPDFTYMLNHQKSHSKPLLEDVLILSVKEGRDYFLPIKGTWMPSCFCRSLDELVVAPDGGVRSSPKSAKNRDNTGTGALKSSPTATHHSAPKELFALTEAIPGLVERSVADWEMVHPDDSAPWLHERGDNVWPFEPSTWTFHAGEERSALLADVREALDTAKPIEDRFDKDNPCLVKLEIVAETLLSFLGSLRDGIVTEPMWSTIEPQLETFEKEKTQLSAEDLQAVVMEPLSCAPVHSVSMTFLTFMLTRIVNEVVSASKEQLKSPTKDKTATSMSSRRSRASSLLSEPESVESMSPSVESTGKQSFLTTFRRNRGQSQSAQSGETHPVPILDRRKIMLKAYAALFAPLVIRSGQDKSIKGKEKKLLDSRKRKVLEAFLETAQL